VAADALAEFERHVTPRYRDRTGRRTTVLVCAAEAGANILSP